MIHRRKRIVLYSPRPVAEDHGTPISADILPLSLLTVAGWPERDGYEIVIIDGSLYTAREAHRRVVEACEGALLYGTTGILGHQVADGWSCSKRVKERHPDLPLIIGGWFASSAPELQLETGLYEAVVLGQGEITFRELVQAIEAGDPLEGVAGLALWRDGAVVRTPLRNAVGWRQLTDMPWHLIDFEPYRELQLRQRGRREVEGLPVPPDAHDPARKHPYVGISYYSSFGCPLQCTFCASPAVSNLRWKAMPAERMLDDLQDLQQRWGFDVMRIVDANYAVMEERVREVAQGLIERDMRLWHFTNMQAVSVLGFQPDTLDLFAESGMYDLLIGAETGTDETMARIKKTTRGDQNLRAVKEISRRGIRTQMTYIIGFPGESVESMMATLDQVREAQALCPESSPQVWPFRPIPGTALFQEALAHGFAPPRHITDWGRIGDYRVHDVWPGNIPSAVARRRKLFHHFSGLSKGLARGKLGFWENRARRRLATGDYRFARLEAKAFDLYYACGRVGKGATSPRLENHEPDCG